MHFVHWARVFVHVDAGVVLVLTSDCFGTYFTHVQIRDVTLVRFGTYFTYVQTCDATRVQSATEWTASIHTLHMSKPVM